MEIEVVLSQDEKTELEQYETIIEMGLNTFFKVGEALNLIKSKRLYRQDYSSFEEYCQRRWDFGRHRANQLIDASQVYNNLLTNGIQILPTNERQTRPAAGLTATQQVKVWQQATEQADGREPTAKEVEETAAQFKPKPKPSGFSPKVDSQITSESGATYKLDLACDDATWRTIRKTFSDPIWAAQVLAAAANLEESELAGLLGIERQVSWD